MSTQQIIQSWDEGIEPYTRRQPKLNLGCTLERHIQLGINAVVNARAGLQNLNDQSLEDIELMRDAHKIRDWKSNRIMFYQFNSRFFRRNLARVSHLLSHHDD